MRGRARCFLGPASRAAAGEAAAGGAAAEAAEAGAGTGLPCTQLPRAAPGCFADASASRSLGLFCFGSGWCAPEAVALLCFLPPRWARTSSALSRLNVSAEPQRVHHRWGAPFGVVNGMSTGASAAGAGCLPFTSASETAPSAPSIEGLERLLLGAAGSGAPSAGCCSALSRSCLVSGRRSPPPSPPSPALPLALFAAHVLLDASATLAARTSGGSAAGSACVSAAEIAGQNGGPSGPRTSVRNSPSGNKARPARSRMAPQNMPVGVARGRGSGEEGQAYARWRDRR